MYIKYVLAWLPMVLLGMANGILREILLLEPLGEELAHQVSTFTLLVLLTVYIWYVVKKIRFRSPRQAWLAGAVWLILTVIFEFSLGYFTGHSLPELMYAYNIFDGHLWILIPAWVGIAPRIFFSLSASSGGQA